MIRAWTVIAVWLAVSARGSAAESPVFEAEWAWDMRAPCALIRDPACSGGLAVTVPDGSTEDDPLQQGPALFRLWLGKRPSGFTRLWARVRWEDVCGNSFVCAVVPGGVRRTTVTGSLMKKWYWVSAANLHESEQPANLELWNREDGICVDQFALLRPGDRPPSDGAPLPPGPGCAVEDDSVGPVSILLTGPVGRSLKEGLSVHPVHVVRPENRRSARQEVMVSTSESVRVSIWLRNTRMEATNVTVRVEAPVGLDVDVVAGVRAVMEPGPAGGGRILTVQQTLKAGEPLREIPMDLSVAEFPMATRPLRIRVLAGADTCAERSLLVTRPLDWMIIGPFPAYRTDAIARTVERLRTAPPDFGAEPGADDEAPKWIRFDPLRHLGACGRIDMNAVFGLRANCTAFACTRVNSETAGGVPFLLENDDGIHVWVNGSLTYSSVRSVPAVTSRRVVRLPLVAGTNNVLVRIDQFREHWQFRLSPEGTGPVEGIPY